MRSRCDVVAARGGLPNWSGTKMEIANELAAIARRMVEISSGPPLNGAAFNQLIASTYPRSNDAGCGGGDTNAARGDRARHQSQRGRLSRRSCVDRSDYRKRIGLRFKCDLQRRRPQVIAADAADGGCSRCRGFIRCDAEHSRRDALSAGVCWTVSAKSSWRSPHIMPDRKPCRNPVASRRTKRPKATYTTFWRVTRGVLSRQPCDQCRITARWHHRAMMTQQLELNVLAAPWRQSTVARSRRHGIRRFLWFVRKNITPR